MKLHDALAKALREEHGVTRLFGLMGDANVQYIARFMDLGGEYVGAVIEGGAITMADGHARMTGRPSVVTVTHGPGMTNSVTALTEAVRAASPLLVLTGSTPSMPGQVQETNLRAIVEVTGAEYRRVLVPDDIVNDLARALYDVSVTRRPLVLDVARDILSRDIAYAPARLAPAAGHRIVPDDDAMDAALGVLLSCRRPVVLAGRGATTQGARDVLLELAEVLDAPVATTLLAKNQFAGEDFDLGIAGTLSHNLAIDVLGRADCLVTFGASLNRYTTVDGGLFASHAVIQCDREPTALGKDLPIAAGVVGDAEATARDMLDAVTGLDERPWSFRSNDLRSALQARQPQDDFIDRSGPDTLDMRTATIRLNELLPRDRIVVTDCGRFSRAPWRYLDVEHPSCFTHTSSFGSLGLGLGNAMGMATASPERLTVAVVGDGGGMMGMLDFMTAVRLGLRLLVVVMNNGSYGAEYTKLVDYGLDPRYSLLMWPEFADVAVAMGGRGVTVRKLEDLDQLLDLLTLPGPVLVDVKADPGVDASMFP